MSLRAVLLLQGYLVLAAAMYFQLGEQEEKCIIEEIPVDTLVTGRFLLEPWDPKSPSHSPHLGVTVEVRDPNHEVQMTKRFAKFGKFTFSAHESGQHFFCFQTNSTRFSVFAGEKLRFHLDIQMGEHPVDHNSDKTKGSLENLENSLTHLRGQMISILRQQEYQRVATPACSAFTMTVMLSRHPGIQMSRPLCCRRRRRASGKSARTPTAKFCGGP
ncbi:hypothetical protein fugu_013444 [Takifugu bimaculatus]|uniref:GOLD domain-containing protein n=1 Tax=Takifugu bimaculatus TaxID=433685 RepID=A0A4Z2C4T0_9TELE|nr:hypothetical protein fugu_013444 [Takifugu bimaculatus]